MNIDVSNKGYLLGGLGDESAAYQVQLMTAVLPSNYPGRLVFNNSKALSQGPVYIFGGQARFSPTASIRADTSVSARPLSPLKVSG